MEKIFISVVGLLESEIKHTVKDFLSNAASPERLHFSIVVQDEEDPAEWFREIIRFYNATMTYKFMPLSEVKGVGQARSLAQKTLTLDYEYYLQIDAHSRAAEEWDNRLIRWYNLDGWENESKFIYSTYPKTYGYVSDLGSDVDIPSLVTNKTQKIYYENNIDLDGVPTAKVMLKRGVKFNEHVLRIPFVNDFEQRNHQLFCAGFAFGRTEHFLDVPYDPNFCYHGEELSMSIRMFIKDIKVVEPLENLIYHDYYGHVNGRRPSWFVEQGEMFKEQKSQIEFFEFDDRGRRRLELFLDGYLDTPYGVKKEDVQRFNEKFYPQL